jgi:hypothetical protein
MHVHEVGLWNELVLPHLSEEYFTAKYPAVATHHILKQAEFSRQQINRTIASLGCAFDKINLKWPHPQFCPAGGGRNPQGFDPGDQLDEIILDEPRQSALARCGLGSVQ